MVATTPNLICLYGHYSSMAPPNFLWEIQAPLNAKWIFFFSIKIHTKIKIKSCVYLMFGTNPKLWTYLWTCQMFLYLSLVVSMDEKMNCPTLVFVSKSEPTPTNAPFGHYVHRMGNVFSSIAWPCINQHYNVVNLLRLLTFELFFLALFFSTLISLLPSHLSTL